MNRPNHKSVVITEGFWKEQLDKIRLVTARDILNKFEHDYEAGIMKNYEWVEEGENGKHIGPPWYDGLICEVIRGISDMIAVSYDEYLDQKIDYYTEKISLAQEKDKDGYMNTYTTLMCPEKRWGKNGGSLIWQHEIYNIGCLVEAGIHFYQATGKTKLLKCGIKAADCMCGAIGPKPLENIVPAHSLAEEAMVKLYRLLKDKKELREELNKDYGLEIKAEKYLSLARFWMDHRGVHKDRASFPHYMGEYAQDHARIEEQSEAVGHAVRGALMYTGLAAVGIETGEAKYLDAAKRIWDNVEQTKLHISGGIGAIHNEERFGFQYDLPNDAYLETCAGVALAFWAGEMYLAFGNCNYMDVFECTLYNNVLPGLSIDGVNYFYENPLISDGTIERWNWHGCPCCPPMFLKLMGSLQDYIYTYEEDSIAVNLHMGSRCSINVLGKETVIEQKNCGVPWNGENHIIIHLEGSQKFKISVRKPAWAENFTASVLGAVHNECNEKGYITIEREWQDGDSIDLSMELPAVKVEAHPYVSADVGKVALMKGPFLYCMEEIDNRDTMDIQLGEHKLDVEKININGVQADVIKGKSTDEKEFTAIPYYLWNNRGKGRMNVWIDQKKIGECVDKAKDSEIDKFAAHQTGTYTSDTNMKDWESKLYRKYQP